MAISADEIKKKVLIPEYFNKVIIPEMGSYYNDYNSDLYIRPVVKCPLHSEDTPSMRWYEDTNTFYCFGCNAGGDIITLHQKFIEVMSGTKPSFKDTIDYLEKAFVKGNEQVNAGIVKVNKVDIGEVESSKVEVMRLAKFIKEFESSILIMDAISIEDKALVWDLIDNLQLLCAMKKVNATDCLEYLKRVQRSLKGREVAK